MRFFLFLILCITLVFTDTAFPNPPDQTSDNNEVDNSDSTSSGNPNTFSYTPSRPVVRDSSTGVGWCFPFGICRRQNALSDRSIIALESSLMYDLYLSSVDNGCTNTTGPCGTVYGYLTPYMQQNKTETFIKQHVELQWEVLQKSVDYFCLRSVKHNAYLYLSGQDCQETGGSPQECGRVILYKNGNDCQKTFGWDVTFISNYYVLRSVQFPDVYLYFNATGCQVGRAASMACGKVVGHYFKNIDECVSSVLYQGAFWNIPYQRGRIRTRLRDNN
jgi:hypothetical protein